jgi:hypothetical protein
VAPAAEFTDTPWPSIDASVVGSVSPSALAAAVLAGELERVMTDLMATKGLRSRRQAKAHVAALTGVPSTTIDHVLAGDRYTGLDAIARLEHGLDRALTGYFLVAAAIARTCRS